MDDMDIWKKIAEFYRGKKFVRIIRGGIHPYPDPKYIIGSNFADIGFANEKRVRRLTMFSAIDNLMKGQLAKLYRVSIYQEDSTKTKVLNYHL